MAKTMMRAPVLCNRRAIPYRMAAVVRLVAATGMTAALLSVAGCYSAFLSKPPKLPDDVKQHTEHLDSVSRHLDRYGSASISTPLLADPKKQLFEFKLDRSGKDYFDDAKREIQGAAIISEQSFLSLATALSMNRDPTMAAAFEEALAQYKLDKSRADAERAYAAALSDPSTKTPTIPTTSTIGGLSETPIQRPAEADPSKVFANDGRFSPPLALARALTGGATPNVSNRSAIITAAGDNAVQSIFQVLGNPEKAINGFQGKRAFFGVSMVSVTPGRWSRKGFAADISMLVDIEWHRASASRTIELVRNTKMSATAQEKVLNDMGISLQLAPEIPALANSERDFATKCQLDTSQCEPAAKELTLKAPLWRGQVPLANELLMEMARKIETAAIPDELFGGDLSNYGLHGLKVLTACNPTKLAPCSYLSEQRHAPTVAAVTPMTETQTLDLGSSRRSRAQVALALASALREAGSTQQAQVFGQFAKQLEADLVTRTPQNLVTGYGAGNMIGYQVGPALRALENPANERSKPGERLQRQSFPILMVFGMDREVSGPRIFTLSGKYVVLEPHLRFRQQTRWVRTRWTMPWKRVTEFEIARLSLALKGTKDVTTANLAERTEFLGTLLENADVLIALPTEAGAPPRVAEVNKVYPEKLPALAKGQKQSVVLFGENLDTVNEVKGLIGAANTTISAITKHGKEALSLEVTATADVAPPYVFSLASNDAVSNGKGVTVLSPPIVAAASSTPASNAVTATLTVTQEAGKTQRTVSIPQGEPIERALEVIRAEIEKDKEITLREQPSVSLKIQKPNP